MSWPVLGRYELKYVIPCAARETVIEIARPFTRVDPHACQHKHELPGYDVHTLYFDTPSLTDYTDRLAEKRVRNRLRVRSYGAPTDNQPVFVENKRKFKRWVVKQRAELTNAVAWMETSASRPWLELAENASPGYVRSHFDRLVDEQDRFPVTIVRYHREALCSNNGLAARLTLDHTVTAATASSAADLFAPTSFPLVPPEWLVMELKFTDNPPGWMRHICKQLRVQAVPVSKFGLSVAKGLRTHRPQEARYLTPAPLLSHTKAQHEHCTV